MLTTGWSFVLVLFFSPYLAHVRACVKTPPSSQSTWALCSYRVRHFLPTCDAPSARVYHVYLHIGKDAMWGSDACDTRHRAANVRGQASLLRYRCISRQPCVWWSGTSTPTAGAARRRGQNWWVNNYSCVWWGLETIFCYRQWVETWKTGMLWVFMGCHGAVAMVTVTTSRTSVWCVHAVWRNAGRIFKWCQNKVCMTCKSLRKYTELTSAYKLF